MTPEQFTMFLEDNRKSTAEAIEFTVNGKIRKIHDLLETQNEVGNTFRTKVENHIVTTEKHIATVEPYIVGVESTKRVAGWVAKGLMAVGAFVLTVGGAWVFIKHNISGQVLIDPPDK